MKNIFFFTKLKKIHVSTNFLYTYHTIILNLKIKDINLNSITLEFGFLDPLLVYLLGFFIQILHKKKNISPNTTISKVFLEILQPYKRLIILIGSRHCTSCNQATGKIVKKKYKNKFHCITA